MDIPEGVQLLWPFNLDLGGIRLRSAAAHLVCRIQATRQPGFVLSAVGGIAPELVFDAAESATTASVAASQRTASSQSVPALMSAPARPPEGC